MYLKTLPEMQHTLQLLLKLQQMCQQTLQGKDTVRNQLVLRKYDKQVDRVCNRLQPCKIAAL